MTEKKKPNSAFRESSYIKVRNGYFIRYGRACRADFNIASSNRNTDRPGRFRIGISAKILKRGKMSLIRSSETGFLVWDTFRSEMDQLPAVPRLLGGTAEIDETIGYFNTDIDEAIHRSTNGHRRDPGCRSHWHSVDLTADRTREQQANIPLDR